MQNKPQIKPGGPAAAPPPAVSVPLIQTILFQGTVAAKNGQAFIEPVQTILAEGFPCEFNLVILSAATGMSRGKIGCTHTLLADGELVYEHVHDPTAIAYAGTGICFRLELQKLQVGQPCVMTVRTRLSSGIEGVEVPLWVVDKNSLQGGQGLQMKA
jgi:hypothetical protein